MTLNSLLIIGLCLWVKISIAANFDELYEQGKTRLNQEQYSLSINAFSEAKQDAQTPEQVANATGALGLTFYRMQKWEQADSLLQKAVDLTVGDKIERARWLGALADLAADKLELDKARSLYDQAIILAKENPNLLVGLRLGRVETLPQTQRYTELLDIKNALDKLNDAEAQVKLRISLGLQAHQIGQLGSELAFNSFEIAQKQADNYPRSKAEATGQLAGLYEQNQRFTEALTLNAIAIEAAKKVDAHDLLIELEWRQGRLQRALQQLPAATASYQQAISHIETIRHDIPIEYHNGQSSFREILEPVYLGLADLLLVQSRQKKVSNKNELLLQARATVELVKQSELEDFLGSRCIIQSHKNALLEAVEPNTAIIYPIILPDRLEILVSSDNQIQQYTQAIEGAAFRQLAKKLVHSLRINKYDTKAVSLQMHQWLINPVEPWLKANQIKTIVMVPDGVLRSIPLGALYDGKHYLIENYAVAISPGLSLSEPAPLKKTNMKVLLTGVSEPGSVIEHLPLGFLHSITGNRGGSVVEDLKNPAFVENLKQKLSLPGVSEEIKSLEKFMPNTTLLNAEFTMDGFRKLAIKESFSVVHIASHGVFGKNADTSFVMAYDDIINMNDLEQLLKSDKFSKEPVELLTLSACQTAEGDDSAPLGLSGIALKAKVRSVLGTLWPVSDEATALLMVEFYKALVQGNITKVAALRQAQIALLKQKAFQDPIYWSPFIIEGNWL